MTNKEFYKEEILEISCSGERFGILDGKIKSCLNINCQKCGFYFPGYSCITEKRDWAKREHIAGRKISRKDREFLDHIRNEYPYMLRMPSGKLLLCKKCKAEKTGGEWTTTYIKGDIISLDGFDVLFPMVRWEDGAPTLITDLKQLEVE